MKGEADFTALRFWFDLGQYLVTVALGFYVWLGNRSRRTATRIDDVREEVDALTRRVALLESDLAHTPSHEDLGALYNRVNDVAEDMAGLQGKVDGIKGAVEMIHEHLLSGR